MLEGERGALVRLLVLAGKLLELAAHHVNVDRHAGVLQREQADPQRALDDDRPVLRGALAEIGGQGRVRDREPIDDDPVLDDADGGQRFCRGRELDDSGFHDPKRRPGL